MDFKHKELNHDFTIKPKNYLLAKKAKKMVIKKLMIAFISFLILFPLTYLLLKAGGGVFYDLPRKIIFVSSLTVVFMVTFVLLSLHLGFNFNLRHYLRFIQVYDIVQFLLIALYLIFFAQIFVIRTSSISGPSMEPTLSNKDRVLVYQLDRRFKFDHIIVFNANPYLSRSTGSDDDLDNLFIKRIKGMPGDSIRLAQIGDTSKYEIVVAGKKVRDHNDQSVKITYGSEHYLSFNKIINDAGGKIPEGSYFVLGDNFNDSTDSRVLGFIEKKDIYGIAIFRISKNFGRLK